ncbi:arylsulfatase [Roseimicrobium gellanilyticum]|uniref:Arylsulfatase n=1 Tax=Roseimicrobium gellanilyticum TaxID=748857 RepID=A0A366HDD1_9BACT|nr:arylsulfatase [Roseimicrobium gellanilyticum]
MCRFLLSLALSIVLAAQVSRAEKPDIIVILSDDMGFSDIGCYGGEIETPNLDALAKGGLKYTQFYNTARCCPTRAALLTGLYPHQAGIGHMMDDKGLDGYRGELSRNGATMAEVVKPAGYRTYMVGKWHVTKKVNPQGENEKGNWPLQRGFERFYGTIHGAGSFFDPNSLVKDNTLISPYADPDYKPEQYYYTDAISDHAVRFIADHAKENKDKPFFMYVAYTAAHWPMHAKEADMAKYRHRYAAGYDAVRAARLKKARELGVVDESWAIAPQAGGKWEAVKNREYEERCMEVYAAMADCMDQGIGRIVEELKKQGRYENTLIFFMQDNGGCAETIGRGTGGGNKKKQNANAAGGPAQRRAEKPSPSADYPQPSLPPLAADYLQPDMIPKQTRDGYPMRQGYGVMPGGADTYCGYGEAWANVSNTPFREYKHWVHEGGISTPLIAHWPAGTDHPGRLVKEPAHLIDIMATVVDLSGATYPKELGGVAITPMEGVSLKAPFLGGKVVRSQPIFWEHEGNRAVRDGKWKLVAKGPRGKWELYDMEADRTEQHDLAGQHQDVVKDMAAKWEVWAKRSQVIPWIWGAPYGEEKGKSGKEK